MEFQILLGREEIVATHECEHLGFSCGKVIALSEFDGQLRSGIEHDKLSARED